MKYRVPIIDEFVDGFEYETNLRLSNGCVAMPDYTWWLEQNPGKTINDAFDADRLNQMWFKSKYKEENKDYIRIYLEIEEKFGDQLRVEIND